MTENNIFRISRRAASSDSGGFLYQIKGKSSFLNCGRETRRGICDKVVLYP